MPDHVTAQQFLLSEDDLGLVDAMQINPRISWGELGRVLGVDASTVARRWARLQATGAAWTTVMPGPRQVSKITVAYIEIDCEVDRWREIADWLFSQPHVVTVQHLSGELTLWCAVFAPSEGALLEYVVTVLGSNPGVRKIRTNIATRVFDSSRQWRLKVLGRRQAEMARPAPRETVSNHEFDSVDRQLFSLLAGDARTTTAALAEDLGVSQRSVQRRINYLADSGDVEFRCDLARSQAGWHSGAILWVDAPESELEQMGRSLVGWEETRSCAAIAGRANLMLTIALHTSKNLYSFAERLTAAFPNISIVDRQIVLRQYKLYGHILAASGQKTASAPVDPWYLTQSDES